MIWTECVGWNVLDSLDHIYGEISYLNSMSDIVNKKCIKF